MNALNFRIRAGIRGKWPPGLHTMAAGILLAYSPFGVRMTVPAAAQDSGGDLEPDAARASRGIESWQFDISPGLLGGVLEKIENLTDYDIALETDRLAGVQSPGVAGVHPLRSALSEALAGTEARYRFVSDTSILVELSPVSTQVDVIADPVLSAPTYTEPLKDTPQTIMVIDRNTIESQGATTLHEVLRNVTGLTVNAGEGGAPAGDNLTLRGFSARNDIFVDGTRDLGPQSRDPFNVEQVEVIKGPQSAFTGRGSAGGSINLSSKTARLQPFASIGSLFGTDRTKRGTADINTPLPFMGDRTALRLNLMGHDAGVAGRDVVKYNRWGLAPTLGFGLGTATRWSVGYSLLSQDNISDYGIPWVPSSNNVLQAHRNKPAPVPRNTFYGFRDRDHEKMDSRSFTVRVEHDVTDNLTVRNQFRYGYSDRDSMATPPRFASPDSTDIKREMRSWITEDSIYDNRADLMANFRTGEARHSLVGGFSVSLEDNVRGYRSAPDQITGLLNPDPDEAYFGEITLSDDRSAVRAGTQAVYLFDTIRFSRKFQATGGIRMDRFDAGGSAIGWFRGPDGWERRNVPLDEKDTMVSLRGGLVYNPVEDGSLYVSYGSSLNPSIEGLTYGFRINNLDLDPEKTYIVEGGSKWSLLDGRLLFTGALFQVNKTNARTPGLLPDDPPTVLEGRQRIQGVEIGATGHITPRWMIFAGYAFLDGVILESNNASQVGNRFPRTPDHSMNLWSTYRIGKVTLGGGLRHIGMRFSNTSNTRIVEGFWTADAMAELPLHDKVFLRINAFNLTDKYYIDRIGGGHIVPGPSRTLLGGLNFRF